MSAKVVAGFVSFTEITDPTQQRAYNEWHQLDHLPEQLTLPGIAWGQRWVASPRCRATWLVADEPFDAVHYLTLYLLAEPLDATMAEFRSLAGRLAAAGRFHRHRRSVFNGCLGLVAASAGRGQLISPEAVPYRPHRGVHVRIVDATRADEMSDTVDAAVEVEGAVGTWLFRDDRTAVTITWLDRHPLAVVPERAHRSDHAQRASNVRFDGTFEAITPHEWDWFES